MNIILDSESQGAGFMLAIASAPRSMARKKRWSEDMQARFPAGTFERISKVLADYEDRTDFVREAVERELKRREAKTHIKK
jgi:hypothetical protein